MLDKKKIKQNKKDQDNVLENVEDSLLKVINRGGKGKPPWESEVW